MLASVVFLIGVELVNIAGLRKVFRSGHRTEFGIGVVTAATVVAWGVEQGIVLAIVLSILSHLRHSYSPRNTVLTSAGEHDWQALSTGPAPQVEPGLVVFRWGASLYFANAARFEEQVLALAEPNGTPVKWICVDAPAIGDVDYTGGETIIQVDKELDERGVRLVLAGVGEEVRAELDGSGVTDAVGADAYYTSVADVLQAYRAGAAK